jgi:hypothetical protein
MRRCHCIVCTRVTTCDCCSRCQGKPTTSASNCCCVRVRVAPLSPVIPGHMKCPVFSRRAAHRTPKPSCTSSLTRVARALAKRYPPASEHGAWRPQPINRPCPLCGGPWNPFSYRLEMKSGQQSKNSWCNCKSGKRYWQCCRKKLPPPGLLEKARRLFAERVRREKEYQERHGHARPAMAIRAFGDKVMIAIGSSLYQRSACKCWKEKKRSRLTNGILRPNGWRSS